LWLLLIASKILFTSSARLSQTTLANSLDVFRSTAQLIWTKHARCLEVAGSWASMTELARAKIFCYRTNAILYILAL
jgi:hypothetical protein